MAAIKQDSCLLNLPAELRNEIYSYVFGPDAIAVVPLVQRTKIPTLLGVCRAIRLEASPMFYGRTVRGLVRHCEPQHTIHGLHSLGKANCALIKRLELDWTHGIQALLHISEMPSSNVYPDYNGTSDLARSFAQALFRTGVEPDSVILLVKMSDRAAGSNVLPWVHEIEAELMKLSGKEVRLYDRQPNVDATAVHHEL